MKILIQVQQKNFDLENQVQVIAAELEKFNHSVEWSTQSHPARLLLNQYDLIYFITDSLPLNIKNFMIVLLAKSLQKPLVISTLETSLMQNQPKTLFKKQLQFFDAISVPEIKSLKNLRFFNGKKWILSFFPQVSSMPIKSKVIHHPQPWIIPIYQNFEELLHIKNHLTQSVGIDGTFLRTQKSHILLRQKWASFIKKNSSFKNAALFLEKDNLFDFQSQSCAVIQLNHLNDTHPFFLNQQIEEHISLQNLLILSESQASSLADFWKHQQNVLIQSNRPEVDALPFESTVEKMDFKQNRHLLQSYLENKMNEMNRLFVQLVQQKRAQIGYENMPYRS